MSMIQREEDEAREARMGLLRACRAAATPLFGAAEVKTQAFSTLVCSDPQSGAFCLTEIQTRLDQCKTFLARQGRHGGGEEMQVLDLMVRGLEQLQREIQARRQPVRPPEVVVSGMPLMFRGFNGSYQRRGDDEYYKDLSFYFGIPIRPSRIRRKHGHWVLEAADWGEEEFYGHSELLGEWPGGVWVTLHAGFHTWFYSNRYFVVLGLLVMMVLGYLIKRLF